MTAKERILKALMDNPKASSQHIAQKLGIGARYVRTVRAEGTIKVRPPQGRPKKELTDSSLKWYVKEALKTKDHQTLQELTDRLDVGNIRMKAAINELKSEGHTIVVKNGIISLYQGPIHKPPITLNIPKMSTGFYKFGLTGDNHLCSRYQRLDVLNGLYDVFAGEGISTVFNTGNWIDGEARFNKHDLVQTGMGNQVDYFLEHYPQRKGIVTRYITGDDHEGWYTQREGVDVGWYTESRALKFGRQDLVYLGHMEADVILPAQKGKTTLRLVHPGGGSSYAVSYTTQKLIESYTGGEKPDIMGIGHYHKAEYLYNRSVHAIQTGCTEDQTPFMRKLKLAAHLGGWIIEFAVDDIGTVTRFKSEFFPMYDQGYYKKWAYKWK